MILVKCSTNLDEYQVDQISQMVAMPSVGQKVTVSKEGSPGWKLTIVEITHCQSPDGTPFIVVELNK